MECLECGFDFFSSLGKTVITVTFYLLIHDKEVPICLR